MQDAGSPASYIITSSDQALFTSCIFGNTIPIDPDVCERGNPMDASLLDPDQVLRIGDDRAAFFM